MAEKKEKSRILRIIGVQIFEETSIGVRKSLLPGWYPFIKCSNDKEMGTSRDVLPLVSEDVCPQNYYKINDDLPEVSISVIVGKNGTGKSSLMDIVYRIINNLAASIILKDDKDNIDIETASGVDARLYFEIDGVLEFIECKQEETSYYKIEGGVPAKIKLRDISERQREEILNGFFFTISTNYSLYAFNPSDYNSEFNIEGRSGSDGKWLKGLNHRKDGYYIPLVLTPYRENGQIDIKNENALAKQRTEVFSLLFHSQNKEFLEGYEPYRLSYRFNSEYRSIKEKHLQSSPILTEIKNDQKVLIDCLIDIWKEYLKENYSIQSNDQLDNLTETALFYLAYKTLKIIAKHQIYRENSKFDDGYLAKIKSDLTDKAPGFLADKKSETSKSKAKEWYEVYKNFIISTISEIVNSPSNYINIKILKCIDFLKGDSYKSDSGVLDVDKDLLKDKKYKTYDEMMRLLPPPFFKIELIYTKCKKGHSSNSEKDKITLQSMSSGERQMLYSMSSIYYHINNIANTKGVDGKREVSYHHINLIFDEAELYYHPEFQRRYVKEMLEGLSFCHINRVSIRSINVIIVTHSPFILSDLPRSNVLFLNKENQPVEDSLQTLGANIYDLLKSGFFLDYAIGDVVQMKLHEIMDLFYYKGDENIKKSIYRENRDEMWYTVNHLGEKYLKDSFTSILEQMDMNLLDKTTQKELIETRINSLKDELSRLESQEKKL